MKRKYMIRVKPIVGIIGTSAILGVGSNAVEKLGGNASGINTIASFMPAIGGIVGGKMVLDNLEGLSKLTGSMTKSVGGIKMRLNLASKIKRSYPALKQQAKSVYDAMEDMGTNLSKGNNAFGFSPHAAAKPKKKAIKHRRKNPMRTKVKYVYVQPMRR